METSTWSTPECPFTVEYAPHVLDDIRLAVVDAFFSLPRGGAEIGGVLLGRQENGRVVITGAAALDCEHAYGPSFTLSPRDLAKLGELLSALPGKAGSRPVGWYHSHTRSEVFLSEADQEIHQRFFPESWQVALVLKPHTFQPTRAGFFFREPGGAMQAAASYREFTLNPLPAHQVPQAPFAEPLKPEPTRKPSRVITLEAVAEPVTVEELPATVEPLNIEQQSPEPPPRVVPPPNFLGAQGPPPRRWPAAALAVLAGLALGAAAYQTSEHWLPLVRQVRLPGSNRPAPSVPVGLAASDQNGEFQIRWNPENAAVRQAQRAIVTILDGGSPWNIELDRSRLQTGVLGYARQSDRVDVTLRLLIPGKPEAREISTFVGRLPVKTSPPPQARDALAEEAARLKTELNDQISRTKTLERSMENMKLQLEQRKRLGNQAK